MESVYKKVPLDEVYTKPQTRCNSFFKMISTKRTFIRMYHPADNFCQVFLGNRVKTT